MRSRFLLIVAFFAISIGFAQAAPAEGGKGAKGRKGGRQPEPPRPADEEKTGLAVGADAPKFALKDQNGEEITLDSLLENGRVALVFHRSADW